MTNLQKAAEQGSQAAPNLLGAANTGEIGGGGQYNTIASLTYKVSAAVEDTGIRFDTFVNKITSDFSACFASKIDNNNIVALYFTQGIVDNASYYFSLLPEVPVDIIKIITDSFEPGVIYTEQNMPVVEFEGETLTLTMLHQFIVLGSYLSAQPFQACAIEVSDSTISNTPFITRSEVLVCRPGYVISSDGLSLVYTTID